jgi:predicted RND superfamily exporter protein
MVFRGDLGTIAWNRFAEAVGRLAVAAPDLKVTLAGMQRVGTAQVERMTSELAWSFASSFVLIFVLVWLQCRSVPLATVAMVSCLLPMMAVLALMFWLDITLRPLTVIAFCVAFGLMIDDAIHLVARWQEERRAGRVGADAVREMLGTAGRPVVVTTLLLLVGFLTILGSEFRGTWTFGFLVVVSLVGALVAALVLVPALLVHVRGRA